MLLFIAHFVVCMAQVEAYGSKIADEMGKLNALETEENRE